MYHSSMPPPDPADLSTLPLPNLYTTDAAQRPPLRAYRDAHVVFVHLHKTGGTSVKSIVSALCKPMPKYSCVSSVNWVGRARMKHLESFQILHGTYTFGVCDTSDPARRTPDGRGCGYFALFREPVSRMVSDYEYCVLRGNPTFADVDWPSTMALYHAYRIDDLCSSTGIQHFADRALAPSLVEWARARGNHMLHQLSITQQDVVEAETRAPQEWTGIEVQLARVGSASEQHLEVALRNFERWFAVVGLTDRFAESVTMWRHAFGLDATAFDVGAKLNSHRLRAPPQSPAPSPEEEDEEADALPVPVPVKPSRVDAYSANELEAVREATALDAQLYAKAVEVFERQLAAARAQYPEVARDLDALRGRRA